MSGFIIIYVTTNPEPSIIFQSPECSATAKKDGLTTTLDVGNNYSHSLVLIGGTLGDANIVVQ